MIIMNVVANWYPPFLTGLGLMQVWAGNLAKFLHQLKEEEAAFIPKSTDSYAELASIHAKANSKSVEELLGQSSSEEFAAGVVVQW